MMIQVNYEQITDKRLNKTVCLMIICEEEYKFEIIDVRSIVLHWK